VRLCTGVKSSVSFKTVRSTSVHHIILALHAIRKFTAVFTKSGKGTCLSPTLFTLPQYVPSRSNVIFSSDRAVGRPNSLTYSEQNSGFVSYSHHARYLSRQSHHPSKTKARCTDNLNTGPVISNTVRNSQGYKLSCSNFHSSDCYIYLIFPYECPKFIYKYL
jgi:hypothetical protein